MGQYGTELGGPDETRLGGQYETRLGGPDKTRLDGLVRNWAWWANTKQGLVASTKLALEDI